MNSYRIVDQISPYFKTTFQNGGLLHFSRCFVSWRFRPNDLLKRTKTQHKSWYYKYKGQIRRWSWSIWTFSKWRSNKIQAALSNVSDGANTNMNYVDNLDTRLRVQYYCSAWIWTWSIEPFQKRQQFLFIRRLSCFPVSRHFRPNAMLKWPTYMYINIMK